MSWYMLSFWIPFKTPISPKSIPHTSNSSMYPFFLVFLFYLTKEQLIIYKHSLWITSACVHAQSYLTLCNLMNCSPPGSSVHGSSQARILEWVVISYSRVTSWPGIKPTSPAFPALEADCLPLCHPGRPMNYIYTSVIKYKGVKAAFLVESVFLWICGRFSTDL